MFFMELNTEILTTNFNKHHKTPHFHSSLFSETQPLARETSFNMRSSAFRGTGVHTPTSPHRSTHYGITRVLAHLLSCLISPRAYSSQRSSPDAGAAGQQNQAHSCHVPSQQGSRHAWLPGTWPRGLTAHTHTPAPPPAQAPPQPRHKGS